MATNEYTVAAFPYTRTGTLDNSDPDQSGNPNNYYGGGAEDLYLLALTPGETIRIYVFSDCLPSHLALFDNSTSYNQWFDFQFTQAFVVRTGVAYPLPAPFGRWADPFGSGSTALFDFDALATAPPGIGSHILARWVVPASVTSAVLAVHKPFTAYTAPAYTVPQNPSNYTLSITSEAAVATPIGNAAY